MDGPGLGRLFEKGDDLGGVARVGADPAQAGVVSADDGAVATAKFFS